MGAWDNVRVDGLDEVERLKCVYIFARFRLFLDVSQGAIVVAVHMETGPKQNLLEVAVTLFLCQVD